MLEDKIIKLDQTNFQNATEVLDYLSDLLIQSGAVKSSYKQAIKERELVFPTGLAFQNYGIAIPHADVEHVNYSQLAVLTLKEPVEFKQMATGEPVKVNLVVMLALKKAHEQVKLLSQLMAFFQKSDEIEKILACKNENLSEVISLLEKNGIS